MVTIKHNRGRTVLSAGMMLLILVALYIMLRINLWAERPELVVPMLFVFALMIYSFNARDIELIGSEMIFKNALTKAKKFRAQEIESIEIKSSSTRSSIFVLNLIDGGTYNSWQTDDEEIKKLINWAEDTHVKVTSKFGEIKNKS